MAASKNKRICSAVVEAIDICLDQYVEPNQTLLVGLSGGLDSTVLLHATWQASKDRNFELAAIHVHHGLSPSADQWAAHCRSVCQDWQVPLIVKQVDVPRNTGKGIEDAARRERHLALADYPSDWIALAHHADDQAETLLLNLIRGAGILGAAAMSFKKNKTLRPLLLTSRSELLAYAKANELIWVEDESNENTAFARNFIRKRVFPVLQNQFPATTTQFAAATQRFSEAQELLEELALIDLREESPKFPLPLRLFCELPELRARNLLRSLLAWRRVQSPGESRLNEFVRQIQTATPDRHPRMTLPDYELWSFNKLLHFKSSRDQL